MYKGVLKKSVALANAGTPMPGEQWPQNFCHHWLVDVRADQGRFGAIQRWDHEILASLHTAIQ